MSLKSFLDRTRSAMNYGEMEPTPPKQDTGENAFPTQPSPSAEVQPVIDVSDRFVDNRPTVWPEAPKDVPGPVLIMPEKMKQGTSPAKPQSQGQDFVASLMDSAKTHE